MSSFELKMAIAWGIFLTFLVIAFYVIIVKKVRKLVTGKEEREAPDFVLENIKTTLEERNQISETLRQREERNAAILSQLEVGIATFDPFKVIRSANPRFLDLFSLTPDMIGESIARIRDTAQPLFRFVRDLNPGAMKEPVNRTVQVDRRAIRLRANRIQSGKEAGGVLVMAEDVTEMEAAKRQLELKKRLEVLGEMSAGLAHEFRNALSTLKGYAYMIPDHPEKTADYCAAIQSEVESMDELVEQFLLYAKPLKTRLEEVDLKDLLHTIPDQFPDHTELMDIDVPLPVPVQTDPKLLTRCLVNLVRNALNHLPDEDGRIRIECGRHGGHVRILVQDNGCGMEEDIRQRAFIPFFTTRSDGTGLGLALCEKIISRLGGTIELDSAPGAGTTVVIVL